eukprot:TRINITY_DN63975_c0_g2_i1.p1 TRINITY_DN63975_c0_g2~~TRINITY_DN63975_c0_g2_i1.p1  ORF type:complete len:134 (-),score=8.37 TRINITY_DN63975_c0_g2_i1:218-619(-)
MDSIDQNVMEVFLEAAENGEKAAVHRTLNAPPPGFDLNWRNEDGHTALYLACVEEQLQIAELLHNHGAILNITDYKNLHTALAESRDMLSWLDTAFNTQNSEEQMGSYATTQKISTADQLVLSTHTLSPSSPK